MVSTTVLRLTVPASTMPMSSILRKFSLDLGKLMPTSFNALAKPLALNGFQGGNVKPLQHGQNHR